MSRLAPTWAHPHAHRELHSVQRWRRVGPTGETEPARSLYLALPLQHPAGPRTHPKAGSRQARTAGRLTPSIPARRPAGAGSARAEAPPLPEGGAGRAGACERSPAPAAKRGQEGHRSRLEHRTRAHPRDPEPVHTSQEDKAQGSTLQCLPPGSGLAKPMTNSYWNPQIPNAAEENQGPPEGHTLEFCEGLWPGPDMQKGQESL